LPQGVKWRPVGENSFWSKLRLTYNKMKGVNRPTGVGKREPAHAPFSPLPIETKNNPTIVRQNFEKFQSSYPITIRVTALSALNWIPHKVLGERVPAHAPFSPLPSETRNNPTIVYTTYP